MSNPNIRPTDESIQKLSADAELGQTALWGAVNSFGMSAMVEELLPDVAHHPGADNWEARPDAFKLG